MLATGDVRDLLYAALEARMGLEGLFYALLKYYREELPDDITKKWQPRQVIEAILRCNPFAESHQQITLGPSGGGGGQPLFAGSYKPVTRKLLAQYYHRLGSYLHATVDGAAVNEAKLRAAVSGALDRLEQHCRETTVIANIGPYITVECECGRQIKRNILALAGSRAIECPDPECAAIYHLVAMAPVMQTAWTLRVAKFQCGECQHLTAIGVHRIYEGARLTCGGCNVEFELRSTFTGERITPPSTTDADADGPQAGSGDSVSQ